MDNNKTTLPRMRTIQSAVDEIKEIDPNTKFNASQLRRMVKDGRVPSVKVGRHRLVNLDRLISYLASDAYQNNQPMECAVHRLNTASCA